MRTMSELRARIHALRVSGVDPHRLNRSAHLGNEESSRITGGRRTSEVLVFLSTGLAFLIVQVAVAVNAHLPITSAPSADDVSLGGLPLDQRVAIAIIGGLVGYAAFAGLGVILARDGRGLLGLGPAATYILLGVLSSSNHAPTPVGTAWTLPCGVNCAKMWFTTPWFGAIIDFALVGIPILYATRAVWRPAGSRTSSITLMNAGCALALSAIAYRTIALRDAPPEVSVTVTLILFGLIGGLPSFLWLGGHALLAAAATGPSFAWVAGAITAPARDFGAEEAARSFISVFVPMFALTVSAGSWQPLDWGTRFLKSHPMRLLIATNVLNVADAALTGLSLGRRAAVELNPVIRYAGLPLKVVGVLAASLVVYRLRPQALLWPVLVLFLVVCYHVSGLFIGP